MRLLVYRFSAFGDVLMVATVLREFLMQNPHVEVLFVSRQAFAPIFEGMRGMRFHGEDFGNNNNNIQQLHRLAQKLHTEFQPTYVADMHGVLRTQFLSNYLRYKGVPVQSIDKGTVQKKILTTYGAQGNTPLLSMHERYADVFRALGFQLKLSNELVPQSERKNGVGFAPFAQHKGKVMPIETAFILAKEIARRTPLYLFGARGKEQEQLQKWVQQIPNAHCVAGQLSLQKEMKLIAQLHTMVSMDSANMHLASFVGTRCVSVWGATHHYAGFLGYGQSVNDIVEDSHLSCRPCSVFGNKNCHRADYACLHHLQVPQIIAKIFN